MLRKVPFSLAAVFGVAVVLRAAFVFLQLRYQVFDLVFEAGDSDVYREMASNLLHGHLSFDGAPTAYVGPGYPVFLAGLSLVGAVSTMAVGMVQALLGALTAVVVADVARRVSGVTAGWMAGLIAAFYPHSVFWTGYVLTETLYVFLFATAVWLAAIALERNATRWAAAAGAVIGAAALVRPIALGFAAVAIVVGVATGSRHRRLAVAGLLAVAVLLIPWTVRNAVVLGAPVLTTTESGYVLWQGNSPGATGGSRGYVDRQDFSPLELPDGLTEVEQDRTYRQAALRWMAAHPWRVIALVPVKLWNMFRPVYAGASRVNTILTLTTYPVLLAAGVAGLWLLRSRRLGRLLVVAVAYHLLAHGLVTGMIRFRLPVEILLMPPAGVALAVAWRALRERTVRTSAEA